MQALRQMVALTVLGSLTGVASAANITGEYLEARTCNVYTGPCFANAEMSLAGKEAVMAWKVDKGEWNNVKLDGLAAAVVVKAQGTLGTDGVFPMDAGKIKAVVLIDEKANEAQQAALLAFVKETAKDYTKDILAVKNVSIELKNDHVDHVSHFKAGELAEISTRKLKSTDCVCTNETVFYQPLTKVENTSPAYSTRLAYQGNDLGTKFINRGIRSAFMATFRQ